MFRSMIWPRAFVYVIGCVLLASWAAYTVTLSRRISGLEAAYAKALSSDADIEQRMSTINQKQDNRLNVLESSVFGTKVPTPEKIVVAPDWLLNTAKQNRDRIAALEHWRATVDEKIK